MFKFYAIYFEISKFLAIVQSLLGREDDFGSFEPSISQNSPAEKLQAVTEKIIRVSAAPACSDSNRMQQL